MFAVPFDEIAPIVGALAGRGAAARQPRAAPRAAARPPPDADLARQREVVDAFMAAAREGDFDALVAVLDPDDRDAGRPRSRAGGRVGRGPRRAGRGRAGGHVRAARARSPGPRSSTAPPGSSSRAADGPLAVAGFTVVDGRVVEIDLLADPARLRALDVAAGDG